MKTYIKLIKGRLGSLRRSARHWFLKQIYRYKVRKAQGWASPDSGVLAPGKNSQRVIAVTIGCYEGWRQRAAEAARLFTQSTGISCRIIDESYFDRVASQKLLGIGPAARAACLKLHVFDIIPDQDNIICFDSDLAFLKEWDVSPYLGKKEFVCVKDRWYYPPLKEACRRFQMDPLKYFNSGFFIANRRYHRDLLTYTRKIYDLAPQIFWEQTALNFALQELEVPVHFLSQSHNCMYYEVYPESVFAKTELVAMHGWKPVLDEAKQRMWQGIFAQANSRKEFYYDRAKMAELARQTVLRYRRNDQDLKIKLAEDGSTGDEDFGWLLSADSGRIVLYDRDQGKICGYFDAAGEKT